MPQIWPQPSSSHSGRVSVNRSARRPPCQPRSRVRPGRAACGPPLALSSPRSGRDRYHRPDARRQPWRRLAERPLTVRVDEGPQARQHRLVAARPPPRRSRRSRDVGDLLDRLERPSTGRPTLALRPRAGAGSSTAAPRCRRRSHASRSLEPSFLSSRVTRWSRISSPMVARHRRGRGLARRAPPCGAVERNRAPTCGSPTVWWRTLRAAARAGGGHAGSGSPPWAPPEIEHVDASAAGQVRHEQLRPATPARAGPGHLVSSGVVNGPQRPIRGMPSARNRVTGRWWPPTLLSAPRWCARSCMPAKD